MKCENCGSDVRSNQKFCTSCGGELNFTQEEMQYRPTAGKSFEYTDKGSILNFDRMITPSIIKFIFGLGVFIAAILSVITFLTLEGFTGLIAATFVFFVLTIVVRLNCEIIIVIFKIHECLVDIRRRDL